MAQIIIEIPDTHAAEVRDAFADIFGWTDQLGVTKTQFAKQKVADFVKQIYKQYKVSLASNAATQAAVAEVDVVIIT